MHTASLWWHRILRTLQVLAVLLLVGIYPTLVMNSHRITDDPVILSAESPWVSPATGAMVTLIGREMEGPGWAADRPGWHPQARLTALPAWQESLSRSLSEFARLQARQALTADGNPDPDLSAAARLLVPEPDMKHTPRLAAAAEALARYEGRLERDLATAPSGTEDLLEKVTLFSGWADDSVQKLSGRIGTREGWPAAKEDVKAFYEARARAHVASQLLAATLLAEPDIAVRDAVLDRLDRIEVTWRRAAELNPLFISSQSGDARLMADHVAMMAFYVSEAGQATRELGEALRAEEEARIAAAAAAEAETEAANAEATDS